MSSALSGPLQQQALIVVHGPPGAGKSRLASALGEELRLPVFDRDDIKDEVFDVLGWSDREWSVQVGELSWKLIALIAVRLLHVGASVVLDSNFRPADPLPAELRRLCAQMDAVPVEVYCVADPDLLWRRFRDRKANGARHPGHVGFERREDFLSDLRARPHGPLSLGGDVIEIDTSGSWPDPRAIAAQVRRAAGRFL